MSESYSRAPGAIGVHKAHSARRTLRGALDFINNDCYLTDEGITAREALLEEIEAVEHDLEAIRQEHGLS